MRCIPIVLCLLFAAMVAMVLPAKIKRRKISLATCLQLSNPQDEPCSNNPSIDSCVIRHDGFPVLVTDGCPLTSYRCKHLELGWRALLATRIGDIEECCDTGLYEDRQICVMNKPIK